MSEHAIERRAHRLVALYPRGWRDRFGDEFEQLLIDEMHERPHSHRRTGDVAAHAVWARMVEAGVVGRGFAAPRQAWVTLRGLAVISAVFVAIGSGMWSQLTIGWQWSPPPAPGTRAGMWMMCGALAGLAVLVVAAMVPIGWSVLRALVRRQLGTGAGWLALSAVSGVAFWLACRHVGAGWPGTGGHPWAERGLVPAGLARVIWAATLWISAYWAHPGALRAFPSGEIAWMCLSPVLITITVLGALRGLRQLVLSAGALRWLALMAGAGVACAALLVAGAASWVLCGSPGPHGLFEVGLIDDLGLVALAATLVAASHSARRAIAVTGRLAQG